MIDAVLSYHANPDTCGVTKFNVQLAEKLGVPHDVLSSGRRYRHPLVSIKTSEMNDDTADGWWMNKIPLPPYDLLLHDRPDGHLPPRVLYADELGCPSTLRGDSTRKGLTILSFGMAHKFQAPLFREAEGHPRRDGPRLHDLRLVRDSRRLAVGRHDEGAHREAAGPVWGPSALARLSRR
jgi:hypothetical protein